MKDIYQQIGHLNDFSNNNMVTYFFNNREILVIKIDNKLYAVDNICSHSEQPLCDGTVIDQEIECPSHGAKFNIESGEPTTGPALLPIDTFKLKLSKNGEILIES